MDDHEASILSKLFPCVKDGDHGTSCLHFGPNGWACTRMRHTDSLHIRHDLGWLDKDLKYEGPIRAIWEGEDSNG